MKPFDLVRCDYDWQAESNPNFPAYRSNCRGCQVRSFAGSVGFWYSQKANQVLPAYRDSLEKTFGADGWRQAHEEVKAIAARNQELRKETT